MEQEFNKYIGISAFKSSHTIKTTNITISDLPTTYRCPFTRATQTRSLRL